MGAGEGTRAARGVVRELIGAKGPRPPCAAVVRHGRAAPASVPAPPPPCGELGAGGCVLRGAGRGSAEVWVLWEERGSQPRWCGWESRERLGRSGGWRG